MKQILALSIFLLISWIGNTQELIESTLDLSVANTLNCSSCSGSCSVNYLGNEVITYDWYNSQGSLILSESHPNGFSQIQNLCVGSYELIVSNGNDVLESGYFAVTDGQTDFEISGEIFSCSNYDEIDLGNFIDSDSNDNGFWLDPNGLEVSSVISAESSEGIYSYNIPSGACTNSIQIPVIVNDPANSGNSTTYIICEDFEEFDLLAPLAGDPDTNGDWLDSNLDIHDGSFNPAQDDAELFTYFIDSVTGCDPSFSTLLIVKNFLPYAGEDGELYSCSLVDETVQLFDYINGSPEANGSWYDSDNNQISGEFNPSIMNEGLYRYTVAGSVPCPADVSYVDVVMTDELIAGDDAVIELCSTENPFSLIDELGSGITEGGTWYDSEGNVTGEFYDPAVDTSEIYTYQLSGVGCQQETAVVEVLHEVFEEAGESSSYQACESGSELDLLSLLSDDASLDGTWLVDGEVLSSSIITDSPIETTVVYFNDHLICENDSAFIDLLIDDNPNVPVISDIFLCDNLGEVNLGDYMNLDPFWEVELTDENQTSFSLIFDTSVLGAQNLNVQVDPNNSCPVVNTDVQIFVESNQFENQVVNADHCDFYGDMNLGAFIEEELGTSDFDIFDENSNLVSDGVVDAAVGYREFTVIEVGLNSCEEAEVNVELTIHEYTPAGPNQAVVLCETELPLNLSDLGASSGEWFVGTEEIETITEDEVLIYQSENHPSCPVSQASFEVTFQEPFLYNPIGNYEACEGGSLQIASPVADEFVQITWEYNTSIDVGDEFEINPLEIGNAVVYYSMSDGVCSTSDQFQITVYPEPNVVISGSDIYCSGELVSLEALGDFDSYAWSFMGEIVNDESEVLQFESLQGGVISIVAENSFGCEATDDHEIVVNQTPNVSIDIPSIEACAPFDAVLQNIYAGEVGVESSWVVNGELMTSSILSLEVGEGDVYDIELVVVSDEGCSNSDGSDSYIIGLPAPTSSFEMSQAVITEIDNTVEFSSESHNYDYLNWYVNGFYEGDSEGAWQYNFTGLELENEVCLETINDFGCKDTLCRYLFLEPELSVYVPNSFTPDNDGMNELFLPSLIGFSDQDYEFLVFDRWGEVIFSSEQPKIGWNGNVKEGDHYASPGVYTYVLKVREEKSLDLSVFKGSVTLLR